MVALDASSAAEKDAKKNGPLGRDGLKGVALKRGAPCPPLYPVMSNCQSCVHFFTRQGGVGGDFFDHSQGQGARVAGRVLLLSPQRCVSAFVLLPLIFCLRSCLHHLVSIREGPRAQSFPRFDALCVCFPCQTSFRGAAECQTIRWRWRRRGVSSTWPSPEPRSVGDLVAMLLVLFACIVCGGLPLWLP